MNLKLYCLLFCVFISGLLKAQVTVTSTTTDAPVELCQAAVYASAATTNYNSSLLIYACDWTAGGGELWVKSYLKINLSSIPTGATITQVKLYLYSDGTNANSTIGGSGYQLNACWLNRTTSNWSDATVTWNSTPTVTTANHLALANSTSATQDYVADITQLVKDMRSNPGQGDGLELVLQNYPSGEYSRMSFYSSAYSVVAKQPRVEITYGNPVIASAGSPQSVCVGNSVTIGGAPTASGGCSSSYTYSWSPATGLSATNKANPVATPSATTTYTVTVTDVAGCGTASGSVLVTVNPLPIIYAVTGGGGYCTGGSGIPVGLNGSEAGLTYKLENNGAVAGSTSGTGGAINFGNETAAGTYQVNVGYPATGCTRVMNGSAIVSINPLPVANAGSTKSIYCYGGSVAIGGSPTASGGSGSGYTYTWSPATGLNDSHAANPVASPSVSTTYSVTVTDGNGCISSSSSVLVTVNPLMASAGSNTLVCRGDYATLGDWPTAWGGAGSYQYSWSPSIGLSSTSEANPDASPTSTTTYTVTVTDGSGCRASSSVLLTVNSFTVSAGFNTSICPGEHVTLGDGSAFGGLAPYSYWWSPATGLSATNIPNPEASPTLTTEYILMVTDANGCEADDNVGVEVWPVPSVNAGSEHTICQGDSVKIGGNPTASGTGFSIYWESPDGFSSQVANPTVHPSSTTTYTVSAYNMTCSASGSTKVVVNPAPNSYNVIDGGSYCLGDQLGIPVSLNGSQIGVNYQMYNGGVAIGSPEPGTGAEFFQYQKTVGLYTIKGTNITTGCTNLMSGSATVSIYPLLVTNAGPQQEIIVGGNTIIGGNPTASGGSSKGYSYVWSPATGLNATNIANPLAIPVVTTNYSVTVTDIGGCGVATSTITVKVSIPAPSAPSGLTDTVVSPAQINLYWIDNANNEDGFKIERKVGTGEFVGIDTVGSNITFYKNTGLLANTSYTYRVAAFNAGGNSGYSNEVLTFTSTSAITINTSSIGSGYTYTISGTGIATKQIATGGTESVFYDGTLNNTDVFLHINNGPGNNATDLKFNIDKQNGISNFQILKDATYIPLSADFFQIFDKLDLKLLPGKKANVSSSELSLVLKDGILLTPNVSGSYDLLRMIGLAQVTQFRIQIFTLSDVLVFDTSDKANYWNGKDLNTNILVPKGIYKYTLQADDKLLSGQFIVDYP